MHQTGCDLPAATASCDLQVPMRGIPRLLARSSQFVARSSLTLVRGALSLALLWPGIATGQATTNVPVQDLTYRHVDRLVAEGLVDTVHVGQRPYSRREVARIAGEAERNLPRLEEKASDTTLTA